MISCEGCAKLREHDALRECSQCRKAVCMDCLEIVYGEGTKVVMCLRCLEDSQ